VNYILDTNVISELVAVRPNVTVVEWIEAIDPEAVFLSVIAVGELSKGIEKLPDSRRKKLLKQWLQDDLLVRFENHLFMIDVHTMLLWGTMNARLETAGSPVGAVDGLIAATAIQHNCTLVTRNTAHFKNTGVTLFNPWEK
jgi:predicted nucleic acid-binding protein